MSYGLVFQTDPMAFLKRPESDLPVLLAVLAEGIERQEQARKESEHGKR